MPADAAGTGLTFAAGQTQLFALTAAGAGVDTQGEPTNVEDNERPRGATSDNMSIWTQLAA